MLWKQTTVWNLLQKSLGADSAKFLMKELLAKKKKSKIFISLSRWELCQLMLHHIWLQKTTFAVSIWQYKHCLTPGRTAWAFQILGMLSLMINYHFVPIYNTIIPFTELDWKTHYNNNKNPTIHFHPNAIPNKQSSNNKDLLLFCSRSLQ